jgi:hypothetical protein
MVFGQRPCSHRWEFGESQTTVFASPAVHFCDLHCFQGFGEGRFAEFASDALKASLSTLYAGLFSQLLNGFCDHLERSYRFIWRDLLLR